MKTKTEKTRKERTKKTKKHFVLKCVMPGTVILLVAAVRIYSYFGGFGTGECANTEEFAKYAAAIENITIPEQTRIVALGEATHGNAEFQQLKLDVFQIMVENYGVRAFALEGDFGGCEAVNRYIHGGEGTAEDAAAAIGFALYRTRQMAELIEWMRSYNETAGEGEDLRFYGFDMQRQEYNYRYLLEAAEQSGADTAQLKEIWDSQQQRFAAAYTPEQRTEIITSVQKALEGKDTMLTAQAIHLADILLQNIELGRLYDNGGDGIAWRDQMMAENTMWILGQEEARGNSCIFISGHNGHMEQSGSYGGDSKVMGNLLADELGSSYFVIGTDWYKSTCNLPKGGDGKRINHTFYSHDPLAKAARECGLELSYLDFAGIPETSELKTQVTGYTWMGSLGESYNALIMNLLPMSYRVWKSPAESYDAMIFVTNAHPTEIH